MEMSGQLLCAPSMDPPSEVVSDHSSSHRHLLAGQDELGDPHQTHGMVPGQVSQLPRQPELCQTRLLILDRVTCTTTHGRFVLLTSLVMSRIR